MALDDEREHNLMIAIFSVAAGMIGVCLTGISLLQVVSSVHRISTLTDEMLAVDAVFFLACCLFAFLSFRVQDQLRRQKLRKIANGWFFLGLLMMAAICGLITMVLV